MIEVDIGPSSTIERVIVDSETSIRTKKGQVSQTSQFIVMVSKSYYNAIHGWSFIHGIKVVPSSYHQCMGYPVNGAITTIYGQQSDSHMEYKKNMKILQ